VGGEAKVLLLLLVAAVGVLLLPGTLNPPHFLGVVVALGVTDADADADLGVGNLTIGLESPRTIVLVGAVVVVVAAVVAAVVGNRGGNANDGNAVDGDAVDDNDDGDDDATNGCLDDGNGLGNGDAFLALDSAADNVLGDAGGVASDNFGTFNVSAAGVGAAVLPTRGDMVTKGGVWVSGGEGAYCGTLAVVGVVPPVVPVLVVLVAVGVGKEDGDGMVGCDCAAAGRKKGCAVVAGAGGAVTAAITGEAKNCWCCSCCCCGG
jgi:hypothetical protein